MSDPIECYKCERVIPWGESYMSVNYQIEHAEPLEHAGGPPASIQVESAYALLIFCHHCAPPASGIAGALRVAGYPVTW